MDAKQLKTLIESGGYKADPAQVAAAMLRRRGVRELLTGVSPAAAQGGRSPSPRPARSRAV
jgi:hypothetical protein